jgi:sugar/nucleoside kinase (ribokinase family)
MRWKADMKKLYDVLAVGIAAVDDLYYVADYPPANCKVPVIASTRHGGGPACTAIATVGSLQGQAAYVARLGSDDLSNYIRSAIQHHRVDISHLVYDSTGGPYHSIIVVDNLGHRNVFYDPSLYRVVTYNDLPDSLIQSASLFLLDHLTEPALIEVAEKVRSLGVPILGDIEGRSESALNLVTLTDYLIVPAEFAKWASGTSNLRDACALLARPERLATIVTNGAEGCYFSTKTDDSVIHFPAFSVNVVDTNGCGDTFHGAFGLAIARNLAVQEAITFASAAAALKAMGAGGRNRGWDALPTPDDVILFLHSRLKEPERSPLLDRLRNHIAPTQSRVPTATGESFTRPY